MLQNAYPVLDNDGGSQVIALYGTPGLKELLDLNNLSEARGVIVFDNYLYVVCGKNVYKVDIYWNSTTLTGVLRTDSGKVYIEKNNTQILIVDRKFGYYYEPYVVDVEGEDNIKGIEDLDVIQPTTATYQDGYGVVTAYNSESIWISGLDDFSSWNILDFTSAEGFPDLAYRVLSDHREVWVFGGETTEVLYNSGNPEFPIERVPGGYIEKGIKAPASAAKVDNSVFWLDNNSQVLRADGYRPRVISTRQIEYQMAQMKDKFDARAYTYIQEGHTFYELFFPSDGKKFVYDASTNFWHTRASGNNDKRHRGNCYALFNNKRVVGDFENGKLYEYDLNTYQDNGEARRFIRRAQVVHADRVRIVHNKLELEFESGTGLTTGQGSDPQAMLRWSDDGGHTWSNEKWADIGQIGEYRHRVIWRRLGQSRNRIYEVVISDPVKVVIISAILDAVPGTS